MKPILPEDRIGVHLAEKRYRVVAHLGEGSMAFVFRAYDSRLETDVVIKIPRPEKVADPDFLMRFRRESQLMVRLTHPHVVKILDVGEHQETPFVAMQFLSGGTLKDQITVDEAGRPMTDVQSLKGWVREVSKALDFVHTQNIVHRDVKPANILFDEYRNAFLSDFGLTKIMYGDHRDLNSEMTAAGFVVGTPNYVAPEIVLGKPYDGRADQYSLGITIYHALCGKPPMQGASSSATMVNQTQKSLPLLSDLRRDVPEAVGLAVNRAIQKRPDNRFATCEEFAEALLTGLAPHSNSSSRLARTTRVQPSPSTVRQEVVPQPRKNVNDRTSGDTAPTVSDQSLKTRRPSPSPRPGRPKQNDDVSHGPPGLVKCPACRVPLPLKPIHAGRTGRCIHCRVRLTISEDLTTLTRVRAEAANAGWYTGGEALPPKRKRKTGPKSSSAETTDDSGELLIGEKLFGWTLEKKVAVALASIFLFILIVATVILTIQWTSKSPEEIRQEEIENLRRETERAAAELLKNPD
ncbi:MAG: serine/threonine-protein kinase [Planctomycetaceae bacterium]